RSRAEGIGEHCLYRSPRATISPALTRSPVEIFPMRRHLLPVLVVVTAAGLLRADDAGKSALQRNPKGWIDLLGPKGRELSKWQRVVTHDDAAKGVGLSRKPVWTMEGGVLVCDGVGVKEMLLYEGPE